MFEKLKASLKEIKMLRQRRKAEQEYDKRKRAKQEETPFEVWLGDEDDDDEDYEARDPGRYKKGWSLRIPDEESRGQ